MSEHETDLTEEWRDVCGYEGAYQISSAGRLRSVSRVVVSSNGAVRNIAGKTIRIRRDRKGYSLVQLYKGGVAKTGLLHRLVAEAFLPSDNERPHVNHKDGNKDNNTPGNLEWCTPFENNTHAINTGLHVPLSSASRKMGVLARSKLTADQVCEVLRSHESAVSLSKRLPVGVAQIRRIRQGRAWKETKVSPE